MSFIHSRTCGALMGMSLLMMSTVSHAIPHKPSECRMRVTDISLNGRPLTYQTVKHLKGATRVATSGVVYTPLVGLPTGRTAIYAIDPSGCARRTGFAAGLR